MSIFAKARGKRYPQRETRAETQAIRNHTILIVGDQNKSLLNASSDAAPERYCVIEASRNTAPALFLAANVVLVVFGYSQNSDVLIGRAMKEARPWVAIIVLAENWKELEGLSFADVLLSASLDTTVLSRDVQAQLDAMRRAA
jgi:hypothetical protein